MALFYSIFIVILTRGASQLVTEQSGEAFATVTRGDVTIVQSGKEPTTAARGDVSMELSDEAPTVTRGDVGIESKFYMFFLCYYFAGV